MAEANNYKSFYGDPVPGHVLAERLGAYTHMFNLYWWVGGREWIGVGWAAAGCALRSL
jgi:hypothetical protein